MAEQMRQNDDDFQPNPIDIYSSLYYIYTDLWSKHCPNKQRHTHTRSLSLLKYNILFDPNDGIELKHNIKQFF